LGTESIRKELISGYNFEFVVCDFKKNSNFAQHFKR